MFHEPRSLEMPVHEYHGGVIDLPKFSRTGPTNYTRGICVLKLSKLILVLDLDRCSNMQLDAIRQEAGPSVAQVHPDS